MRRLIFALIFCTTLPIYASSPFHIVLNRSFLEQKGSKGIDVVYRACRTLAGGNEHHIHCAGRAYLQQFEKKLAVAAYPSDDALTKAKWLRTWLSMRIQPGATVVLIGDEHALPTWELQLGSLELTTDSPYCDLTGDGIPETAVTRIIGPPELMLTQLRGKTRYGNRAAILCSEDTRVHLETRAFTDALSKRGYDVSIFGKQNQHALSRADFIIHFGHGNPEGIYNRFGEPFVTAADMPTLTSSPVVFIDGCATLPVGSPLLRAFFKEGAVAYVGSTATVHGMIPARFTNELVEHFLHLLAGHPQGTLPQLLTAARAMYAGGHPGLAAQLKELAEKGSMPVSGEERDHLLTVSEWVCYGDPRCRIPRAGAARTLPQRVVSLENPAFLNSPLPSWHTTFTTKGGDGHAVVALFADIPLREQLRFQLALLHNGRLHTILDRFDETRYQHIGRECRGGYRSGTTYRARFLIPLDAAPGNHEVQIQLVRGTQALLTPQTGIEIWPAGFEETIDLRYTPSKKMPEKVTGNASLRPLKPARFTALDLKQVLNRPHGDLKVGGRDNASFKTWFTEETAASNGVPFLVKREGDDVLVSPNNTQNVFHLHGFSLPCRKVHVLFWGYNLPENPAPVVISFDDQTFQKAKLPLTEWTRENASAAFDFENTVKTFRHAAVMHHSIEINHPTKKVTGMRSISGTYGIIAVTFEK